MRRTILLLVACALLSPLAQADTTVCNSDVGCLRAWSEGAGDCDDEGYARNTILLWATVGGASAAGDVQTFCYQGGSSHYNLASGGAGASAGGHYAGASVAWAGGDADCRADAAVASSLAGSVVVDAPCAAGRPPAVPAVLP